MLKCHVDMLMLTRLCTVCIYCMTLFSNNAIYIHMCCEEQLLSEFCCLFDLIFKTHSLSALYSFELLALYIISIYQSPHWCQKWDLLG